MLTLEKIDIITNDKSEFLWTIPSGLSFFNGHFPNNPILPAYAIIEISLSYLATVTSFNLYNRTKINKIRFKQEIHPKQIVKIYYQEKTTNSWTIYWKDSLNKNTLCLLKIESFIDEK